MWPPVLHIRRSLVGGGGEGVSESVLRNRGEDSIERWWWRVEEKVADVISYEDYYFTEISKNY
ncbi:hypothetical protein HanIR_Chr08g0349701 [Helianthus annuus]|nr:hypothetical protein HanIR_Chr08g0349701 [Helianthus annuus]